jgi:hypothetical protein
MKNLSTGDFPGSVEIAAPDSDADRPTSPPFDKNVCFSVVFPIENSYHYFSTDPGR